MTKLAATLLLALVGCQPAGAAPRHLGDGEPGGVWCFYHDLTARFPTAACPWPWRPDRRPA